MSSTHVRLLGVSDVSVGYGSPQNLRLMQSLASHYGVVAQVLEPDQTEKKPLERPPDGCLLERLATPVHPHSERGRREYVIRAAERIDCLRPQMLVLFSAFTLPVLLRMRHRPRFTVYYALESIRSYGDFEVQLSRYLADKLDLVVFPEENRARLDGHSCDFLRRPIAIAYNVRNECIPPTPKVPTWPAKFIYTGTLDRDQTFAEYFLHPGLADIPIDVFGQPTGRDNDGLRESLARLAGSVRYRGYVPAAELDALRSDYAYSIVMWAPQIENQLYAAPNKFFDAIADGIPPVVAPHPQCKLIVDRYGCGILMDDWSFTAFLSALERAQHVFGTPEYERMVDGCRLAVARELNWPAQFGKIKRSLPLSL